MITPQDETRIARAVRRELDEVVGDALGKAIFMGLLVFAAIMIVSSYGLVKPLIIGLLIWAFFWITD
jgi:hypothetical protein